ncbi:MAG: cellulose-binding protein CttA-related protein, partial [Ruminococcus sp.]|nr:cellulose-binding protein CttA-related protein [Ruminococcus sp.]
DSTTTTLVTDDPSSTTATDDTDSTTTTATDDPSSTTTTTDNTDSTTTTTMSGYVRSYAEYNTETATYGFYFSHDDGTYGGFHAEQIDLGSVRIYDVYEIDGEETVIEREDLDIDNFNFNGATPASVYSDLNTELKYNVPLYYNDLKLVDKNGYALTIEAYIGLKGDVNLDRAVNSVDPSQMLAYYSGLSTGGSAATTRLSQSKLVDVNEVYDEFAAFLGDVNEFEYGEGNWKKGKVGRSMTSVEASQILFFYSLVSNLNEAERLPVQEAWDVVSPERNGK